jgi:hypothetical protein
MEVMMNFSTNNRSALARMLQQVRCSRTAHARHAALARDLATFDTPAALLDVAAMLDRYPDQETAELRASLSWARAA